MDRVADWERVADCRIEAEPAVPPAGESEQQPVKIRGAMVEQLAAWHEAHRLELEERGIQTRLERSPNDGRSKSAWLTMQRGTVEGEIAVWDSGECELWGPVRRTEITGTDPQAEHRELNSEADLSAALARVVSLFD